LAGFAKVSRVCRDSLRRKIFRVVDLFIVLYSLFFIRYLFSRFASEENLPAVDPIIILYFLIVIGYSSGFTTEENLQGCWFVYCSLFFVLYSIFIFKVYFGGKSSWLSIRLLFFIFWLLLDIPQGSLRRKIFRVVDLFIVLYSLFFIRYLFSRYAS
jgi:hypothetical protein